MVLLDKKILKLMLTNTGESLDDLSNSKPVMLVFLRHFGCQFCRGALDELSSLSPQLAEAGTELVFVHMAENQVAESYFDKFNLTGVKHISDISCSYYAGFGLMKGSMGQLFGFQSWIRGFQMQAKYGNDLGKHLGDNFQMPGIFIIHEGKIKDSYLHKIASGRPDYATMLNGCCTVD
jgi:peroxiredoxin